MIGRKFLSFCAGICVFLLVSVAHAQLLQVASGVNYLASSQSVDGTWSNGSSMVDATAATVTALDALKLLNESAGTPYMNGLSWLQGQAPQSVAYTAERIRALGLGAGSLEPLLVALDQLKGAWGGGAGYETDILDTAIVLQALRAANYADATVTGNALAYLTANQNPDGGWGFHQGGDSDIYMTSVASAALQQYPQVTSIATAVNKASAYLVNHQNGDGGFGASGSTAYETAVAYSALVAVSSNSPALSAAINYLTVTQSSDGSWQEDPYSTALALKALHYSENRPAAPPAPPAGGGITGTVVDAVTKARVPNVAISLANNSLINTTSDSSGNFTLSDVPPGAQSVAFSLTGYAAKTASADVTVGGVTSLDNVALLSSYSTGYIAGAINDAAGKPLPGVTVTVTGAWSGSATTGPDGTYSFSYVTPGQVTMTAAKTGCQTVTAPGVVYARTTLSFSPRMSSTASQATTGTLVGRVVDSYWGVPMGHLPEEKGVRVLVPGLAEIPVEPEGGGYFSIPNLAPGTYQILIGMFSFKTFRVVITPGGVTDLGTIRLDMSIVMTLTGNITDASTGAPIPGAEVTIQGKDFVSRTDSTGTYAIADIPVPAEYTIKFTADGYTGKSYTIGASAWLQTMDIALSPKLTKGSLTGTVVDAAGGRPLAGATLTLANDASLTATTDSAGAFTMNGIPMGRQQVSIALNGYTARTLTTRIIAGTVVNAGNLALGATELPATIQGRVTKTGAQPFEGVTMAATGTGLFRTVTAADGTYRIDAVAPGTVTVSATALNNPEFSNARLSDTIEPGGILLFSPVLGTTLPGTLDLGMQTDKPMYGTGEKVGITASLRNRQTDDMTAALHLRMIAPDGIEVYETTVDLSLAADGSFSQPFSFVLPATAASGRYTIYAEAHDANGNMLKNAYGYFNVSVSQIMVSSVLPTTFAAGDNAISFNLANIGTLPVSAGALAVTLKDPDGQLVSTARQNFSLDLGASTTISVTLPVPALKFGTYTLSYLQSDETKIGIPADIALPNTVAVTALYDDASRRIRGTANLTVTLRDTGRFNVGGATVTAAVPDAGYSETKPLSSSLGSGNAGTILYQFTIPETMAAGQYGTRITVTLPSGSTTVHTAQLTIMESSLGLAPVRGTFSAGGVITPVISNSGGVDTQVQYRMSLYDAKAALIAETVNTGTAPAGSTLAPTITIPLGAVEGSYNLVVSFKDGKTGRETSVPNGITINGVKGSLQVQTDKENYLLTENIAGLSGITNTGTTLQDGNLHLQVTTGLGVQKTKTWTTQADFQTGVRNGVDTYGVNDWIIPDDDFGGTTIDSNKWTYNGNVSLQAGRMFVDSTVNGAGFSSKWQLEGDFDIQVDYDTNNSSYEQGPQLAVSGTNVFATVHNNSMTGDSGDIRVDGIQYYSANGVYRNSGKLRITRVANTLTTYFWNGSSWSEINHATSASINTPCAVSLYVYRNASYTTGASAYYDNFKVNSGRIKTKNQTVDSVRLLPLSDNFDDGVFNADRWINGGNPSQFPMAENNGVLDEIIPAKGTTWRETMAISKQTLTGDFDISVNYDFTKVMPGNDSAGFQVTTPDYTTMDFLVVVRWPSQVYGSYAIPHGKHTGFIYGESASLVGRLRITRIGTTYTSYYWKNNSWVKLFSYAGPADVPMLIWVDGAAWPGNGVMNAKFDNFTTSRVYPNSGSMTLKYDSGQTNTWKTLSFNGNIPTGTSIKFRTRTAETEAGLASATWSGYLTASGSPVTSPPARWIEVETTLSTTDSNVTPLLHDLTVSYEVAAGSVLWQSDVPANLAPAAISPLNHTIGTLGMTGKFYLEGTLTSSTGQTVAYAEYPFYIEQGNTQVVLNPDKKIYRPGEVVTVAGETRNFSGIAAAGLTLNVKGNDGSSLHSESLDLAANSSRPFRFTTVAGNEGVYGISGSLTQNTTIIADTVAQYEVATPVVSAQLTAPDTVGEAPFTVSVTVGNTSRVDASANVRVVDDAGDVIGEQAVTLAPGETRILQYSHQVYASTTYSATLTGDLNQVLTKTVSFSAATATVTGSVSSKIVSDRVSYKPNEQVALSTTIASTYMKEGLSAQVAIVSGQGQAVYTATSAIPSLMQGQAVTVKTYWNCGATPAGTYVARVSIVDASGQVVSTASCDVVISKATVLKGKVTLDKQSILTSEPVNVTYSATNTGNADVALLSTWLRVINLDGTVLFSTGDQTALALGATHDGTGHIETVGYDAKDYLVLVGATIDGTEEMLASTYFRVEGAPSVPALFKPAGGADVDTATPILSVSNAADPNDDRLSYAFEVYSDRAMTTLVASGTVPETTGTTSWSVPEPLVENGTYFWRARAYDGRLYGMWMDIASFRVNVVNDPPSAPTVSVPVDGREVAVLNPVLAVNNATDPDSAELTYNFDVSLDAQFTQIVASVKGVTAGEGMTSWEVPVSLQENTFYYWRAQADDWFIEGPWSATAAFFVNTANDAPSAPVVVAPVNGATVAALAADIVIQNSVDPDSAALSYYFEADTKATFDSPDLIRPGAVAEGTGGTAWHVSGLKDNSRYFVRVKASDGAAESTWSAVSQFAVNTVNDPPTTPVLANPSNGAGVTVFSPTLSVHNATDLDHDSLTYQFAVYADAAMTQFVAGVDAVAETGEVTSWLIPQVLAENTTYYWHARAFDGVSYSEWMSAAAFTVNTANDAPSAPKPYLPADNSSVETTVPVLQVVNAYDPDSGALSYDFEIYSGTTLVASGTRVPGSSSGVTGWAPTVPLADNSVYLWRARAYDGESYGPWTTLASFTVHVPTTSINAAINFDPDTLNRQSGGTWVVVYIELPDGYRASDIDVSSIRLEGSVPAEARPYSIGDHDKDGNLDLMVKFRRSDVINLLSAGEKVTVHLTGKVGEVQFEGVDIIRVIK